MNQAANNPVPVGLKKSFGFGDRLGVAGPGHLSAARQFDFAPILAQQSVRELTRTQREPEDVMQAAQEAVVQMQWDREWGADADHLKTAEDIERFVRAGYTLFTLDPSDYVNNRADAMSGQELEAEVQQQIANGVYDGVPLPDRYLEKRWDLETGSLSFDKISLMRAAVKYGRALRHCERLAQALSRASTSRPFEVEISIDETDVPTSPLEHLWIALELRHRGISCVGIAPRFIGSMEKGIDYRGDLSAFERELLLHVNIARSFGPYKLSIHSGSDKFGVYPVIGRCCGSLLHVKTAGTSYLEALRVVLRTAPYLFREIAIYAIERFDIDRASYHISTTSEDIRRLDLDGVPEEYAFLDSDTGRQLLHVTFGSVLVHGKTEKGQPFKEAILETLSDHADLHQSLLERHFTKHLAALTAG